jgi:uncharacterized membrane protein YhaH (DUF805 family)
MQAIAYYGLALLRSVLFRGRASPNEFWFFWLTNAALLAFFGLVQALVLPFILEVYAIVIAIPSLSVTVRRLHDVEKPGGAGFIGLVPVLGWIVLVYWLMQPGTKGTNRFGPDPILTDVF